MNNSSYPSSTQAQTSYPIVKDEPSYPYGNISTADLIDNARQDIADSDALDEIVELLSEEVWPSGPALAEWIADIIESTGRAV